MLKNLLKELRKEKGFTQKKIALLLNMSETGYASWEQGLSEPNIEAIKKLSTFYDITIDELLESNNARKKTVSSVKTHDISFAFRLDSAFRGTVVEQLDDNEFGIFVEHSIITAQVIKSQSSNSYKIQTETVKLTHKNEK